MPVKRYFLSGIDYFQLLIDHHNKRNGGVGHEARLAIYLDGIVAEKDVEELISGNEICIALSETHISKSYGLGYPSLVFSDIRKNIPITYHRVEGNEIPDPFLNIAVDVFHSPPLHVQVFFFENKTSCILFTFHHILFDFAGVSAFIKSLTGIKNIPLLPTLQKTAPFRKRARQFFKAIAFTFKEANFRMTIPERELPAKKPLEIVYKELVFTLEETNIINENTKKRGLQLSPAVMQVSAICKALHDEIFSKQTNHNFIWVPVPVNIRKKGIQNAVLFNKLSFLFYKLRTDQLNTLEEIIASIQQQMKIQVKDEMPQAFIDFADGYWYMPMPFYYPMLNLPSLGKLSSFSFSTLGNTFAGLDRFMNLPVNDVKNYPSNSIAPGFTFLFYEFRDELRLMTSWVKGQYSEEEREKVMESIRKNLLG